MTRIWRWLWGVVRALARWIGIGVQELDIDPFFQQVWTELERAVRGGRTKPHRKIVIWPNHASILLSREDYRAHIEPVQGEQQRILRAAIADVLAGVGAPADHELFAQFMIGDPTQVPLAPGEVRVVAERVSNDVLLELAAAETATGCMTVRAVRSRRGTERHSPTGPGGSVPPPPATPLVRLAWRDYGGDKRAEISPPTGSFGREDPAVLNEVVLDPGPDPGGPLYAVSRRALEFGVDESTGRARVKNCGKSALVVEAASVRGELAAEATAVLTQPVALVWPDAGGGVAFRLEVTAPVAGEVEMSRGDDRQVVALRAPRCVVEGSKEILHVDSPPHLEVIFDGPGDIITVVGRGCTLTDDEGRILGRIQWDCGAKQPKILRCGEVQIVARPRTEAA